MMSLYLILSVLILFSCRITGHLGSGQFGKVAKGVWHTDQGDLDIAVKKLNDKASERDTVRFLQEAAIMGQFKHPNIVRLHGVVTVGSPVRLVDIYYRICRLDPYVSD